MVQVEVNKTLRGYEGMRVVEHAGDPLICAAVSGIMQGLAGALVNIDTKPNITTLIIQPGLVEVEVAPLYEQHEQDIINAVFFTAYISLKQIEKQYPKNIRIIEL